MCVLLDELLLNVLLLVIIRDIINYSTILKPFTFYQAGVVGAVGKIPAFSHKVPGSIRDLNTWVTFFFHLS